MNTLRTGIVPILAAVLSVFLSAALANDLQLPAPKTANEVAAARLLQQALVDEAQGNAEHRQSLLDESLRLAPKFAPARWIAGQLQFDGKWQTVESIQQQAAKDRRLAEYRNQRNAVTETDAAAQAALAAWCRKNKLDAEAQYHWRKTLELDPQNAAAQKELHVQFYDGTLLTNAEVQQRKKAAGELKRSMERWRGSLTAWRRALDGSDLQKKQAAIERLETLNDLSVIPAYEALLSEKDANQKDDSFSRQYVNFLARTPRQATTEALARQAVDSPWPTVADAALAELKNRDLMSFVPQLMGSLRGPIVSEYAVEEMPGRIMLYTRRSYREGALVDDLKTESVQFIPRPNPLPRNAMVANREAEIASRIQRSNQKAITDANDRAKNDDEVIRRENQATSDRNARITRILAQTTGVDIPPTATDWWDWWRSYNELQVAGQRPVRTQSQAVIQESRVSSCFAQGTPVWTISGVAPIESIKAGDRVLAQDSMTGELAFKVVVAATVRPESPILKITSGAESISTTLGHRFWNEGQGWRMAKQLEAGASLKTIRGPAKIESIDEIGRLPAHNLIVEGFHTYFVGQQGLLVHDVTAPKATAAGVPGLVPAVGKTAKTASRPREQALAK